MEEMSANKKIRDIICGHFLIDIYTPVLALILPLLIAQMNLSYFLALGITAVRWSVRGQNRMAGKRAAVSFDRKCGYQSHSTFRKLSAAAIPCGRGGSRSCAVPPGGNGHHVPPESAGKTRVLRGNGYHVPPESAGKTRVLQLDLYDERQHRVCDRPGACRYPYRTRRTSCGCLADNSGNCRSNVDV